MEKVTPKGLGLRKRAWSISDYQNVELDVEPAKWQSLFTFLCRISMEFCFAAILVSINLFLFFDACLCTATTPIYSSRLIHRFSDEAQQLWVSKGKSNGKSNPQGAWPEKKSLERMRLLLGGDLKQQRLRLGTQNQLLVPSQGGQTYNYGNDLGWLHYTWIDMGTPNTSFLVALDAGSDLFWVPCDCIQCAPLSLSYYYMLVGYPSPSSDSFCFSHFSLYFRKYIICALALEF
ncbi:Aspartic proteinase-like protein 1 [Abeliophyllum distichum]|uniref:Aspartic proteinase-like protein 1 n=1 Tax=Abeliophyllum distichum TaxID=126358 RepID=A0ABD1PW74_9LAMI